MGSKGFDGRSRPPVPADEVGHRIVERWRGGDPTAFQDLFRAYRSLVYGVLHHLLGNDGDLEDVVQATFLEVHRSLATFEGRSKLSSWVARVALHVGYHHLRRRRSRPSDYRADHFVPEVTDETPRGDPEALVRRNEAIERVRDILSQLAEKKRTVFILIDLQGMAQEDVAEVVGTNVATVRTRLFYARREFWERAAKDAVLANLCVPSAPGDREEDEPSRRGVVLTAPRAAPEDPGPRGTK